MAANASLLDELMGAHRNALPGELGAGEVEWKDDDVSGILHVVVHVFHTLTEIPLDHTYRSYTRTLCTALAPFFCPSF